MSLGMELTMQKKCFSDAFLRAISAVAGCSIQEADVDDDSVDWTVSCRLAPTHPRLDIQMKCTGTDDGQGDSIRHRLKRKNYDDLSIANLMTPRILVLVIVPAEIADWLAPSPQQFVMRHCAYWISLAGWPETQNEQSVTISIPRTRLFTVDTLSGIMRRVNDGGMP